MEPDLLKTLGQIAGIAGIALGIVLLLYREVLGKAIFGQLDPADSYRLLRLITLLVWTLGIGGLAVWGWSANRATQVEARRGVAAGGDIQNTDIRIQSPPATPPTEAAPSPDADVGAVGGAAAGGSISGSTIVIEGDAPAAEPRP